MTTLYTAKKYAVPALEGHCVEFLTKHLRADNAFMLLTQVNVAYTHRKYLGIIEMHFYTYYIDKSHSPVAQTSTCTQG